MPVDVHRRHAGDRIGRFDADHLAAHARLDGRRRAVKAGNRFAFRLHIARTVGNGHMDRRVLPQLHRITCALIVAVYDGLPAVFRRHDDSDVRPARAVHIHDVDFRRRLVLLPLCRGHNRDFVRTLRHRLGGRFGRRLLRWLCRRLGRRLSRRFVRGLSRRLFRRLGSRFVCRLCCRLVRGFSRRFVCGLRRGFFRRFSRFRLPIGFFCFLRRMICVPAFAHVFVLHSFLYNRFARHAFRLDRQH